MKTFIDGLIYFIKTQLLIICVFNVLLAVAYVFVLVFIGICFAIFDSNAISTIGAELFFILTPTLVFLVCGLSYKQKTKPKGLVARYLPIVFPIAYLLFAWLFYTKIYTTGFSVVPWLQLPYHWVFYTPIGFFLTENSELANIDDDLIFFEWILPLVNYSLLLIGYILGDRPFFIRTFKRAKERLWF